MGPMTEPLVFLTGQFLPASEAKLNIYDLGLVLGATFTDMARTFRHRPFRLEDHVDRLLRSTRYGGIPLSYGRAELLDITARVVAHNTRLIGADDDLAIVYFVTPGENLLYAGSSASMAPPHPTVCVHTFRLPFEAWRHLFAEGAHVVTPSIRHVPPECVDPKTKHRSRLHWFLADQQTRLVDPRAVTLLLDLQGNLTECAGSNFVLVKDRVIYSPERRNILWGVSLDTVVQLAPAAGLGFETRDLQVYDVVNADEAWLTTTPYCVAPCTKINGLPIGDGKPGPAWRRIMELWSARVGMDVPAQVLGLRPAPAAPPA